MDVFQKAKVVRLKSCHGKYLMAEDDEKSVVQHRGGSGKSFKWTVEFVDHTDNVVRLKSCYGRYLTASNHPFLLGMTGQKVMQTLPERLDSSVEWEPVQDGGAVKLKTRYGKFLRANGGVPPWRNSVTHDIPYRTATQEWISWEVHVVDIRVVQSPVGNPAPPPALDVGEVESFASGRSRPGASESDSWEVPASFTRQESKDHVWQKVSNERLICFRIADEKGQVDDAFEELCIAFEGNGVKELTRRLEEELGLHGIMACARSPLNGNLYPLLLQLPPNNAAMHVVVVVPSLHPDLHAVGEEYGGIIGGMQKSREEAANATIPMVAYH